MCAEKWGKQLQTESSVVLYDKVMTVVDGVKGREKLNALLIILMQMVSNVFYTFQLTTNNYMVYIFCK